MKYRFKALSPKGEKALKAFHEEINRKKSLKEKMAMKSLSPLGVNVKSKIRDENPYTIDVWYSLLKKMDKKLVNINQFIPTIKTQWFPHLEHKIDYEARLI